MIANSRKFKKNTSVISGGGTGGKFGGRSSSNILTFTWFFILTWMFIVAYSWYNGFLHTSNHASLRFVDHVLTSTENKVLDGLKQLHYPVLSDVKLADGEEKYDIHVIFSTDCTTYQDWQSLALFYSATVVKQSGPVTRIASGCDEEKKLELIALYKKLYPKFRVHFTPDFKKDANTQKKYDFYNKPLGLKHWLEFANPPVQDDSVVALIDPDFIFLRPLTPDLGRANNLIFHKKLASELFDRVVEGKPMAQTYGLGAPWTNDAHKKFNRTYVCGEASPCLKAQLNYGELHYSVGPPYIVHKRDMVRLAATWTRFVPRLYKDYPYLLAEMYAYSMAAAHEKLPHFQVEHHMISNVESPDEGWQWIDNLPNVCDPPVDGIFYPEIPMPTFLHFCQGYNVNETGFYKRRVPRDIFSCEGSLFVDLPNDLARYYYETNAHSTDRLVKRSVRETKRTAFMLCTIHRFMNAALLDYKQRMCDSSEPFHKDKTLNLLNSKR